MIKQNEITEDEYIERTLIPILKPHFIIRRECWSNGTNKRRIDIILQIPNTDIFFGVEVKRPSDKRGEEIGRFIKQAIDYSTLEWDIYKNCTVFRKIPIFINPPISLNYFVMNQESKMIEGVKWFRDRHDSTSSHHSFNGFLGSFGVGEIRASKNNRGSYIFFAFSNKEIFTTAKIWGSNDIIGLHEKNYSKLISNDIPILPSQH